MNILSPINSSDEVALLVSAGANEFYCGYLPKMWKDKYNKESKSDWIQISPNKRDRISQSVRTIDELKSLVNLCHFHNSKIYVTLNNLYYPEDAYKELSVILEDIVNIEIDGLIITDIGLINFVHERYPKLKIILSTCQSVYNSYASKFFSSNGVSRITMPRHLSSQEILKITKENIEIEYEYFILDGKCIYDDGQCRSFHSIGSFCQDIWEHSYYEKSNVPSEFDELEKLYYNETVFNRWSKPFISKQYRKNGWPPVACSICMIPKLLELPNAKSLKISGRGTTSAEKAIMIRFVHRALRNAINGKEMTELACKQFGLGEMCKFKLRCYSND